MVTLHDIAKAAGVSIATVSAVINNNRPVAPKTRKRVQDAIDQLGYRPNQIAKALKKGITKKIIYIIPSTTNLVFGRFVSEIQKEVVENGYDLILYANELNERRTRISADLLEKSRVDGVIISQTTKCGQIVQQTCNERNIPLLVFETPDTLKGVDVITTAEEDGAKDAVHYLVRSGHREIGFLMVERSRVHNRRLNGYRTALEQLGIGFSWDKVIFSLGHDEVTSEACVERHLIDSKLMLTALVCCNDYMAIGAMRALTKAQIRIPQDISVIGCDNSVGKYTIPALTTLDFKGKEMASKAVEVLLNRMENPDGETQKILFSPELVIRDSSRCLGVSG